MTDSIASDAARVDSPPTARRIGWPELGIAVLAGVVLYAVGILIIWSVPAGHPVLAGLVEYAVSGLAPIGAFAAAVLLRIRVAVIGSAAVFGVHDHAGRDGA